MQRNGMEERNGRFGVSGYSKRKIGREIEEEELATPRGK